MDRKKIRKKEKKKRRKIIKYVLKEKNSEIERLKRGQKEFFAERKTCKKIRKLSTWSTP